MDSRNSSSIRHSARSPLIKLGHSRAADARSAVGELHAAIGRTDAGLVLFFCSSHYELAVIAEEINRLFTGAMVVGCTTAGELGPAGSLTRSLSGLSFPAAASQVVVGRLDGLRALDAGAPLDWASSLNRRLELSAPNRRTLGLLLIDGLSGREERVARACQQALGDAPLVGGSAGDDLRFSAAHVFSDGAFRTDSATLILMHTALPFAVLQAQHFLRGPERMVGGDLLASRRRLLDEARQKLGEVEAVLAFDCVHCSLEARRSGLRPALEAQLLEHRVVGFNTYGEQLMGVHMNQTLTGVAFGRSDRSDG